MRQIMQAVELGINFFYTSNMRSQGSSEEIVGRELKDFAGRDEVVIATKARSSPCACRFRCWLWRERRRRRRRRGRAFIEAH